LLSQACDYYGDLSQLMVAMNPRRFLSVGIALVAVAGPTAWAAGDAEELEKAGYLGHWAQDCQSPPSSRNWHIVAERKPDGSVTNATFTGKLKPLSVIGIKFVRRLPDNYVEIQLLGSDTNDTSETIDLTILIEPQRMRTMRAASASEGETVRDGRSLRNRGPMPWLYRCQPKQVS
jgi:hypothetical protein